MAGEFCVDVCALVASGMPIMALTRNVNETNEARIRSRLVSSSFGIQGNTNAEHYGIRSIRIDHVRIIACHCNQHYIELAMPALAALLITYSQFPTVQVNILVFFLYRDYFFLAMNSTVLKRRHTT